MTSRPARSFRDWLAARFSFARSRTSAQAVRFRTNRSRTKPRVSVVVIAYNIPRELPRTLTSLAPDYQRHVSPDDYEVIVVDNGSNPPVDAAIIARSGIPGRLIRIERASPSPAAAINRGIAEARGDVIGVMIDGARLATPGLLNFARQGVGLYRGAVVAALGWYLGADFQRFGIRAGYDQAKEDELLAGIGWPEDGYRLFEVGTLDESSLNGWFAPISESNGLFMSRERWAMLGGVDERFDLPGGGLVNLDTFSRALDLPDSQLVLLLGEGTFHQIHGGISTNAPDAGNRWSKWEGQYRSIRGRPYGVPELARAPAYIGSLPQPALVHFVWAATHPLPHHPPPLGTHFDARVWSSTPPAQASDPAINGLIAMAHAEVEVGRYPVAALLARLARERAPDEAEPKRLLSFLAGSLQAADVPADMKAACEVALGDARCLLGEKNHAADHYRAALEIDRNSVRAHIGLATLRLDGDFYYVWLDRLYERLEPETIVEIGVFEGRSIAYARPPTLVIGVDPTPRLLVSPKTNVQLFTETSDAFFERKRLDVILQGRPLSIGFIDGLHLFEQSLRDFVNLERYCGPGSVILFHDTLPLDEPTQRRACDTQFHTGDVWKTVLCLKHYRPDLDIFTIATPWTGLTVVIGLDPASQILSDRFDEAVAAFIDKPFAEIEGSMDSRLDVVPNDWDVVEARLRARGIV